MTYGRERYAQDRCDLDGAAISHSAELVRGDLLAGEGPLIRPSATFSPRGEGTPRPSQICHRWVRRGALQTLGERDCCEVGHGWGNPSAASALA
jgi:hypothetical protein